jgi:hypothetical protein
LEEARHVLFASLDLFVDLRLLILRRVRREHRGRPATATECFRAADRPWSRDARRIYLARRAKSNLNLSAEWRQE